MSTNIHCWDAMRSEGCCEIGLHDNMQQILHWWISTKVIKGKVVIVDYTKCVIIHTYIIRTCLAY